MIILEIFIENISDKSLEGNILKIFSVAKRLTCLFINGKNR